MTLLLVSAVFALIYARQMDRQNAQLRVANEAKNNFLNRMGHDIRTPMNGILGMIDLADKLPETTETIRDYHKKIRAATEELLSLVGDALDMSKLESKEAAFERESVSLRELLEDCRDRMEPRAAQSGILFTAVGLTDFDPPRVIASPRYMNRILSNVIGNAIKYNKPGGAVGLAAKIVDQTADKVICEFCVTDTGLGMSEDFQKRMFQPFEQEHGSVRSGCKGTGLGLTIVKKIIDQAGGDIEVNSKLGTGTTVKWTLPFEIDKACKSGEGDEFDLTDMRILAAEDNELNAEILHLMLEEAGASTTMVANGKEAVNTFEYSSIGTYDYILMDIMMPEMDGYEASRQIRAINRPDAKTVPIIALTANAFTEDALRAAEAGMDAHMTKPFDFDKLKKCMSEIKPELKVAGVKMSAAA